MNDIFELIEPKANLWIGSLLQVIIISIEGDWVEWYFDTDDDYEETIKIFKSQIKRENVRRYFMHESIGGGRMFYLDEFNYY